MDSTKNVMSLFFGAREKQPLTEEQSLTSKIQLTFRAVCECTVVIADAAITTDSFILFA